MKNSILSFVTVVLLLSTTLVHGQNTNSLNSDLKLSPIHQIDYLSLEMISMFRLFMEEPSVLKILNNNQETLDWSNTTLDAVIEKANSNDWLTANKEVFSFEDILAANSNNITHVSQINLSDKLDWRIQNAISRKGTFENNIRIFEEPIIKVPNNFKTIEVATPKAELELVTPLPTSTSTLGSWNFKFGARDGSNF